MSNQSWPTVVIGIVGTVGTIAAGVIGYQSGARAVEKDYVQIAVTTLDKKDASPELRKWSVDVLNKLSPVPFGAKLEKQLTATGFSRIYMPRLNPPGALKQPCPPMLKEELKRLQPVSGAKVIDLMEQYELCRVKVESFQEWISELDKLAEETNREQGLSDQDLGNGVAAMQ